MTPFRYLTRVPLVQAAQVRKICVTHYLCSVDKDKNHTKDDKVDEKAKSTGTKNADAVTRLNLLLKAMVEDKELSESTKALNTDLAKPKQREKQKKLLENETKDPKEAILFAAKEVAESLGGDIKQTEAELLSKVNAQPTHEDHIPKKKKKTDSSSSSSSDDSSSSDSSSSSDEEEDSPEKKDAPTPQVTPKKLNPTKSTINLSELIVGMKIDRTKRTEPDGRASQVRKILGGKQHGEETPWRDRRNEVVRYMEDNEGMGGKTRYTDGHRPAAPRSRRYAEFKDDLPAQRADLFGHEPLGIFIQRKQMDASSSEAKPAAEATDLLPTWQALYDRELRLSVTHPPTNYFQEMILWTEQGKLWKFPINNEQGLDEEKQVYFADHVFVERHLEPWCPRLGPVRHFMELVCVGLSKNPYLTAKEKHDHIDWFREYFKQKEDILKETGALGGVNTKPPAITSQ